MTAKDGKRPLVVLSFVYYLVVGGMVAYLAGRAPWRGWRTGGESLLTAFGSDDRG